MPLERLERTRRSLPEGYQFGDAVKTTLKIAVSGVNVTTPPLDSDGFTWVAYGWRNCRLGVINDTDDIEGVPV